MPADLASCHPSLTNKFRRLQAALSGLGVMVEATQGFRTVELQESLWAKGRTAPGEPCTHAGGKRPVGACSIHPLGATVTNARGMASLHCHGRAIDFAFRKEDGRLSWDESEPWRMAGEIAKHVGLEWGGDWKSPDRPHVQWVADGFKVPKAKPSALAVG